MNLTTFSARIVSKTIWTIEKLTFYPNLKKALKIHLPEVKNIFDVGANEGQSLHFFLELYPKATIFCFEPNPSAFEKLEKLKVKQVELYNFALGDKDTETKFYESKLSENSTFILPNLNSKRQKLLQLLLLSSKKKIYNEISVKMSKLDTFLSFNSIDSIDLLKIDTEGFELEVLIGANNSLKNGVIRSILLENHETDLREIRTQAINDVLLEAGFLKVFKIKHRIGNFTDIFYVHQKK